MDLYCPVCGAPYGPGEAFCMNCGSRLPAAAPAQAFVPVSQQTAAAPATPAPPVYAAPAYPPRVEPASPKGKPKKSRAGLIIGLSVGVLLLAAAALMYFVFMPFSIDISKTSLKIACGEEVKLTAEVFPDFGFNSEVKWSSSDSDIAEVSKNGTVTGVKTGSCEITASTGNGREATCTVKVKIAPETLRLSESMIKLQVDNTHTLTVTITPDEAKDAEIEWSSSDPAVATVDGGTVTAVGNGTCVITASAANGKSDSCAVSVADYTLALPEDRLELGVGERFRLVPSFDPEDAEVPSLDWSSSDPAVADVDNGMINGIREGTCVITVTAPNGSSDSCALTVVKTTVDVEFISLSNYWVEGVEVGDKFTLTVDFYPSDATNKAIAWSSSDPSVATVNNGTVSAVGPGSCEITATASNGKTASCYVEVTVSAKPITSPQINIGDYVIFGSYEQDNYSYNGQEDIEWLVLDKQGNNVLLISRYALDCQLFNDSMTNATWDMSSLRSWLNDSFYYSAFSADERSRIVSATVAASGNPTFSTNPGSDTYDRVFLLSISEATWYLGSDALRQCKGTAYCTARGAYVGTGGNCWWWLRTPGNRDGSAANVSSSGVIHYDGNDADSAAGAVRPAMWITVG